MPTKIVDPDEQKRMKIIGVALKYPDRVFSLLAPARHDKILRLAYNSEYDPNRGEQGFITDTNEFLDRDQAAAFYVSKGGILKWPPLLYSEDLW